MLPYTTILFTRAEPDRRVPNCGGGPPAGRRCGSGRDRAGESIGRILSPGRPTDCMGRTAIQLHTLRDVDGSVPAVVERVGETAFDGVECFDAQLDAFADRTTLDRTVDALDAAGLAVPAIHVGIDRLESATDDVLAVCRELDCARVVVPTYDGEAFATVDAIDAAADRIAAVAADLTRDDVELLYHNHTFEFDPVDGTVAFERFVDAADGRFGFEPDVGLAAHAGYDPLDLLGVVAGDAPVVHLTDTRPDDPDALHADPGEGVVAGLRERRVDRPGRDARTRERGVRGPAGSNGLSITERSRRRYGYPSAGRSVGRCFESA